MSWTDLDKDKRTKNIGIISDEFVDEKIAMVHLLSKAIQTMIETPHDVEATDEIANAIEKLDKAMREVAYCSTELEEVIIQKRFGNIRFGKIRDIINND